MDTNTEFFFDDVDIENAIKDQVAATRQKTEEGFTSFDKKDDKKPQSGGDANDVSDFIEKLTKNSKTEKLNPDDVTSWYNVANHKQEHEDDLINDDDDIDEDVTENLKKEATVKTEIDFLDDDDSAYAPDVLDVLREEGLLYIPEDFDGDLTEDKLEEFKEITRQMIKDEVIQSIRESYNNDPYTLQKFDYMVFGESAVNMPLYESLIDNIQTLETLNLKDESIQTSLLKGFLSDGLNPENSGHKMLLAKVDREISEILASNDVDIKIKEARDYFLAKNYSEKNKEELRIKGEKQKIENSRRFEEQRQQEWHDSFYKTLQHKQWSLEKKRSVYEEHYDQVQMPDGTAVPVYYAKEMMIKSNPDLYHRYLDWLNSSFDLKTGKFKSDNSEDTSNKKVTRKIMDLVDKKTGLRKKTAGQQNVNKNNTPERVYVNPLDNI